MMSSNQQSKGQPSKGQFDHNPPNPLFHTTFGKFFPQTFKQPTFNHAQMMGYKNVEWGKHFDDAIPKALKA